MYDMNEKEKERLSRILDRLERQGDYEMCNKIYDTELFDDPFHKQAIQLGLLVKPSEEFRSKYKVLREFLLAKKFEGCSPNTLHSYYDTLVHFIADLPDSKLLLDVKSPEIRAYLANYQAEHQVANITLDSMRRIFSSFYTWLETENYIMKNPVKQIHKIKTDKIIKKPFSDEEMESLRDACRNYRELSLIEFLYSSGVRVSELCSLDIGDIDFNQREAIVFGKGGKERIIYFDAKAKVHLLRYIGSRVDNNCALYVTAKYPYPRLERSGVECILRDLGKRAEVEDCHPHRFRRTFATNMLDKGMPIEQVQILLGHTKIDTTLIYANVNQQSVKLNHARYM